MSLEFGLWAPVCGGWLRVREEQRGPDEDASAEAAASQPPGTRDNPARDAVALAEHADRLGYDFCYVPEHYLNAVHGPEHDVADGWMVAAAAVARTRSIRVVAAVQPGFKWPGVVARMAATLDRIRGGSIGLSLIAGWWRLEAETHGDTWLPHGERYARLAEFLHIMKCLWTEGRVDHQGRYYRALGARLAARPTPPPPVFIAGESRAALELCAAAGDYLFINGADPERVHALAGAVKTMARERHGRTVKVALSALAILRPSRAEADARARALAGAADLATIAYFARQMDRDVVAHNRGSPADLVDANLGLSAGLVGDAETVLARLRAFQQAGVDAVLIKLEPDPIHATWFAREVIDPFRWQAHRTGPLRPPPGISPP